MRIFREFELKRLNKIVENAPVHDENIKKIDGHHHKLVNNLISQNLLHFNFFRLVNVILSHGSWYQNPEIVVI